MGNKIKLLIKRETKFIGERKVGLDSGVIIETIDNLGMYSNELNKIFSDNKVFYVHKRSLEPNAEVIKILVKKRGYTKEKAIKEVFDFLKKYKIEIVEKDFNNKEILDDLMKKCKKNNIEIHPPDCWIIADFKKKGINKVYSNNNHFLDASKLIGIDGGKFPTLNKQIEGFFREQYKLKNRRKFKPQYHRK